MRREDRREKRPHQDAAADGEGVSGGDPGLKPHLAAVTHELLSLSAGLETTLPETGGASCLASCLA